MNRKVRITINMNFSNLLIIPHLRRGKQTIIPTTFTEYKYLKMYKVCFIRTGFMQKFKENLLNVYYTVLEKLKISWQYLAKSQGLVLCYF